MTFLPEPPVPPIWRMAVPSKHAIALVSEARNIHMAKVRVAGFGVSLDGFSAGTEQSLKDPLGKRGPEIFQWFFHTKTFSAMHGREGGSVDLDDEFVAENSDEDQNFDRFIDTRRVRPGSAAAAKKGQ